MIRPEFAAHALRNEAIEQCQTVRKAFSQILNEVEEHLPPGRHRSMVATKLEEACILAIRGIAQIPENQLTLPSAHETSEGQIISDLQRQLDEARAQLAAK